MAKNLDDLLNLFFASDGRRNLVDACHAIQRNAKVLQVRRQLKFLPILFFLLLAFMNICAHLLDDGFRIGAQTAQDVNEQAVVIR